MSLVPFFLVFVASAARCSTIATPAVASPGIAPAAPVTPSAKPNEVDAALLQNIFGVPQDLNQVAEVAPASSIQYDADNSDFDSFKPTSLNYDMFDWTLTKRIAAFSNDTFLLSPLGLKLALAILKEAAAGATQAELTSVLGFDPDGLKVRNKFSSIITSLQAKSDHYDLDLSTRIYIAHDIEPRQRFAAIAQDFYKTEVVKTDFDKPIIASMEINDWVAKATRGRITKIVNEDDVASAVVMILNTLYFKGKWRHQFQPNNTGIAPFYVTPTVQKPVQFMRIQQRFFCSESLKFDAKIVRLPYLGHKFSMYIVVPNSLTGLPRVLDVIHELRQEMFFLNEQTIDLTIPKFKFDFSSLLDGVLKDMGIRQAFEDTASFPNLARGQHLKQKLSVSKILQKSGIEVNEIGSVVFSVTEVSLVNKFGTDTDAVHEVVANRPFLFFIEDEATRQLLFTGRISDPTQAHTAFGTS